MAQPISRDLTERVLAKLGFASEPTTDLEGISAIYDAWCRNVPFDNVRKMICLQADHGQPLPGDTPTDFFEYWLKHGTGGTCWAGNGALATLLSALGFDACRGVATMMVAPDVPPNHGTVVVQCDGTNYLTDASMLHGEPIPLVDGREYSVKHPAWGVRAFRHDSKWTVAWRPLLRQANLDCRLDYFPAQSNEFAERHELTRGWSPFNFEVTVRRNIGDSVVGIGSGARVQILSTGEIVRKPLEDLERARCLIDELGYSEEIISALPDDRPTPPPPFSKTAAMERA